MKNLSLALVGLGCLVACSKGPKTIGGGAKDMASSSCAQPRALCNDVCVSPLTDAKNCGACNQPCSGTQMCSGGVCVTSCTGTKTMCSGQCVDTSSDKANCGGCDQPCNTGETCQLGNCTTVACTGTEMMCNQVCVDIFTDPNNCGGCSRPCAQTETCSDGSCIGGFGTMTGCNGLVLCLESCAPGDTFCDQDCLDNTTSQGQQLFQTVQDCFNVACPSGFGDVCDPNGNTTDCDNCYQDAQSSTGACFSPLNDCENDLP